MPCALALAYLVLLVIRFPSLIRWENADSDIASAYVLADAISHGHTGQVVMSTQGSWAPLWYGLLTHGLSFHRVLWELSPALLALATATLIGLTVASVTSPLRGAFATALFLAASPTALFNFTAAFHHNTTIPGVALLGTYLVWSTVRPRDTWKLVAGGIAVSLIVGAFVASDELLAVVGLLPFLAAVVLRGLRTRDIRGLAAVVAVTAGSVLVAVITSDVMGSLNFATTTPGVRFSGRLIPLHAKWLLDGLLRIDNGLSASPHHATSPMPLMIAAGAVTTAAIVALYWLAIRSMVRPTGGDVGRSRDLYVLFWAGSLLCAVAAYVLTTVAHSPTDRYLLVVVPALAVTAALAINGRRTSGLSATAGSVFVVASIVALISGDERRLIYDGASVPEAARIANYVSSQHLRVGYAGYWDAANLDWITHGRLHVYPITDPKHPRPMYQTRVQTWFRARPHTPSFLILVSHDLDFTRRVPRSLPSPQREAHIGPVTIAVYPYDIAALLGPPLAPAQ